MTHAKKSFLDRWFIYFFPFQLLFVVFKKNQSLLIFWALLFGLVLQQVATKYGVPYLFINPEYQNEVSLKSFMIIGFSCGGFIMSYHISMYILNGFRFPFIATLNNPFLKFCINNSALPIAFLTIYSCSIYQFQIQEMPNNPTQVWIYIGSFLMGNVFFIFIAMTYFFGTNKNIFKMFGVKTQEQRGATHVAKKITLVKLRKNMDWKNITEKEDRDWHVEMYLAGFFKPRYARGIEHYEKEMLIKVFKQNHWNATLFQMIAVLSLLLLGIFREIPILAIPAGASVFLLFTLFLMLSGAMHTLFRGWATTVTILIFLGINFLFKSNLFYADSFVYGLNYTGDEKPKYRLENLSLYNNTREIREKDFAYTTEILNNRVEKIKNGNVKPKLVFICATGGGMRSIAWTYRSLLYADSVTDGKLFRSTQLISGASGGMIGAAFLRELNLRKSKGENINLSNDTLITNITKDLLNPIIFAISTNDFFFRFQKYKHGEYNYTKDRAYAMEKKLNENSGFYFQKPMNEYKEPEYKAIIPMMVLSPCIVNDGRKLYVSPQPTSYLTSSLCDKNMQKTPLIDGVEFSRFFEKQNANNLNFTSALRMSATFPYVCPIVSLPSEPVLEVVDAGGRDNYGIETALKFIYTFREWIEENTSGVIIVQTRDRQKINETDNTSNKTLIQSLSTPVNSLYSNLFNVQDFSQNQLLQYSSAWFKGSIDVLDFQLRNLKEDNISLSWHLTAKEKRKVLASIYLPENQMMFERLKTLLKENK